MLEDMKNNDDFQIDDAEEPGLVKIDDETKNIVDRILMEKKLGKREITRSSINQIHALARLYSLNFNDEETVSKFVEFYKSTAARLDPLVNECAILRMILAEEASKPPLSKRSARIAEDDSDASFQSEVDRVVSSFLADTVAGIVKILFQQGGDVPLETIHTLQESLIQNLAPKIVRYGDGRIEEFVERDDVNRYRNDAMVVKLANTINNIEKTRQSIADSLGKAQVQVRFNLLVHQVMNVLDKKCKDKLLLRDVAIAIQELAKEEDLEIDWSYE